jgi:hypothetical protein
MYIGMGTPFSLSSVTMLSVALCISTDPLAKLNFVIVYMYKYYSVPVKASQINFARPPCI